MPEDINIFDRTVLPANSWTCLFLLIILIDTTPVHAATPKTLERFANGRLVLTLLVMRQRLLVCRFADNFLDFVAAACALDVSGEGPLAHAPMLYWALPAAAVATHLARAPIRLARNRTEVTPCV